MDAKPTLAERMRKEHIGGECAHEVADRQGIYHAEDDTFRFVCLRCGQTGAENQVVSGGFNPAAIFTGDGKGGVKTIVPR